MNNKLELIFAKDEAYVDSRKIAEYYEKEHKHVLRDIENMFNKNENSSKSHEILKTSYKNPRGKVCPCYKLSIEQAFVLMTFYSPSIVIDMYKSLNLANSVAGSIDILNKILSTHSLSKKTSEGYCYIGTDINNPGVYKIGKTIFKSKAARTSSSINPNYIILYKTDLIDKYSETEKAIHKELYDNRYTGVNKSCTEWFLLNELELSHIVDKYNFKKVA